MYNFNTIFSIFQLQLQVRLNILVKSLFRRERLYNEVKYLIVTQFDHFAKKDTKNAEKCKLKKYVMCKMNKNRDILEYFTQRNFNFKPKKQTLTKPHKNGG